MVAVLAGATSGIAEAYAIAPSASSGETAGAEKGSLGVGGTCSTLGVVAL